MEINASQFRNIVHLNKVSSSPRIFNVNTLTRNIKRGQNPSNKLFFNNEELNNILVIKHRLRPGEEQYFSSHRYSATKIFVPYDNTDLREGGKFAFLGEEDIAAKMNFEFSIDLDGHDPDDQRDITLLKVLERLPSLDPFLLKTVIERLEYDVDPRYFDISEEDWRRIRAFVVQEFSPLAEAAFEGSGRTEDQARQIADKLWEGSDVSYLEPICKILNISDNSVADIMFSWKGVLFYKYVALTLEKRTEAMMHGLTNLTVTALNNMQDQRYIDRITNDFVESFIYLLNDTNEMIEKYNIIYHNDFIKNKSGAALRELLESAPILFASLGAAIGSASHACSYWEYQFGDDGVSRCTKENFIAMIEDFSDGISTARAFSDDVARNQAQIS